MSQSRTSTISGVMYSECLMPRENLGALALFTYTFSGLCAPGPGFIVESPGRYLLPSMEYAGPRLWYISGEIAL